MALTIPGITRARYSCMGVTLCPSEVVVNRTLTPGGVDMSACLFVSYHHVKCLYMYLRVKFLQLHGLNCEIILTMKIL